MVNNNFYFIIIRENGFIKPFINSFTDIEEISIKDMLNSDFTYYQISIKKT